MQKNNDNFILSLIQIITWAIIISFIIIRGITFSDTNNQWVWIINFFGMYISFINLLTKKCIEIKDKNHEVHEKYKPFKGLTIVCAVVFIFLIIPVYFLQQTVIKNCTNDIITLLAVWFCVGENVWDKILNVIIQKLKR